MKKIELVVFDWAGTMVDYGCNAPMAVFKEVFEEKGIHLTMAEISAPMGMGKKDHIRTLLQTDNATNQWLQQYGSSWKEADVEEMYEKFQTLLFKRLKDYCTPIAGAIETVDWLRQNGIHVGSTTGYTKEMMEIVRPEAKRQGYETDYLVTSEIVGKGRPYPYMLFENMRHFGVMSTQSVIKVGDTVTDILEGLNAGVWSVGVVKGSNLAGITPETEATFSEQEKAERYQKAREAFQKAGANYIIESISDLPDLIKKINQDLMGGC